MSNEEIISGVELILQDPCFIALLGEDEQGKVETALEDEDIEFLRDFAGNIVFNGMSLQEYVMEYA
jgi:hypothetical protein